MKVFARIALWFLIDGGAFGVVNNDEDYLNAAICLQSSLAAFYRLPGSRELTPISNFSWKKLGKRSEKLLRTKGAETYGVLKFLLYAMPTFGAHCAGLDKSGLNRLLMAGRALDEIIQVWRDHDWIIPAAAIQVRPMHGKC